MGAAKANKSRMGAVGVAKDIYLEKFGLDATTFSLLVSWHRPPGGNEVQVGAGHIRVGTWGWCIFTYITG